MTDLNIALNSVLKFIPKVGKFQIDNFRSGQLKGGQSKAHNDFVSRIDVESEHMIKQELQNIMPEAGFFGEETGITKMQEFMWVVDPIDGTTNYLSGIDQFSISIALVKNGEPILGVIYKPTNQETFTCLKGQGLKHNQKLIKITEEYELKDSVIGTGFPFRNFDTIDSFNNTVKELLPKCRGIRRMGSAALDLAYCGCGFFQGFWEIGLQPYDIAAGVLFLKESNYIVTNFAGKPINIFEDNSFVCGLKGNYQQLYEIVKKNYKS